MICRSYPVIYGYILVFSLLLMIGVPENAHSQAYHFQVYSVNQGLPHGQVADIHQTTDGYIWIATSGGGLARFDGKQFNSYTIDHGLRDDLINFVYEDNQQQLWTATYTGGVALLRENRFDYPFEGEEIDDVYVISMSEDAEGNYWFTTYQHGIFIYDGESFTRLTTEDGLPDDTVWDLHWDGDIVWIASNGGLSSYDGESIINYTTDDGLSGDRVFSITESGNGDLWLATSNGVIVFDKQQVTRTIDSINGRRVHYVFDIITAGNGDIWVGTENDGAYRYDGSGFTHLTTREGLNSNYIYRFFEDSEGYVWIGTDENGVSIFRGEEFRFHTTDTGLPSNLIFDLHRGRNGTIWIGTEYGLTSYRNGVFRNVSIPENLSEYRNIWFIDEDRDGNLLVITYDNRLLRFDGTGFRDITDLLEPDDLYIYDLKVDSNGNIWVANDYYLIRYNGTSAKQFSIEDGMPGAITNHIYEKDGIIWAATNNGVAIIDGDEIKTITTADGLGHYNVNHISSQADGTMWFGTGSGVTLYRKGNGEAELVNFGREHGMQLVETMFLWYDEQAGQLWQGTNGGINRLDVAGYHETGQMQIIRYGLSSRSTGVVASHNGVVSDNNGRVWFGTNEGIVIYNPDEQTIDRVPGKIHLTGILLNGVEPQWNDQTGYPEFLLGGISWPNVRFPYGKNSYQFEFAALEFLDPDNLNYRYRVSGFDQDWHHTGQVNYAFYTNLTPGEYQFVVQARIGNGPWSEPLQYLFTVSTPYWMSPWFWLLVLLAGAGAVYGFINYRVQAVERNELKRLVDAQTESLRKTLNEKEVLLKEVHHRVKNNLAVIYSLLELQTYNADDEETANLLRESSLRVHSIALVHEKLYQNDDLAFIRANKYVPDLVNSIANSFGEKAEYAEISLDIDDVTLSLQDGIPCGLMLNEMVTNAYKHAFDDSKKGLLTIRMKKEADEIIMEVSDNGPGLPPDFEVKKTKTLSMTLIRSLSVQLKGDLKVKSSEEGAAFKLTFTNKLTS